MWTGGVRANPEKDFSNPWGVLRTQQRLVCEEVIQITPNEEAVYYSRKNPIFNREMKLIGLWGISTDITPRKQAEKGLDDWLEITSLKSSVPTALAPSIKPLYLLSGSVKHYPSKREVQCIHNLLQGNTAKQIAITLNLSVRTIQHYIENIKKKTQCRTRQELIHMALRGNFQLHYTQNEER